MALNNLTGFETGDTSEATAISGTISIQTSVKRTGAYSLRVNPLLTAVGLYDIRSVAASGVKANLSGATQSPAFYFRADTLPLLNNEIICDYQTAGPVTKAELRIGSDGKLSVYDKDIVLVATGTTVLSVGVQYRIDFQLTTGAPGTYEVKINGATELSGSINNLSTSHNRFRLGKTIDRNGNSVDFYYDDYAIDSSTTFPPDGAIKISVPRANGSTQQWTTGTGSSNFAEVDEIPFNTTTYVKSTGTAGDTALFAMQSSSTVGITGTINAVKAQILAREDSAVTSSNLLRIRNNATNADTTAQNLNATASYNNEQYKIQTTDPNGGGAWTLPGFDTVEIGSNEANAVSMRMTAVYAQVHYTPAVGGVQRGIGSSGQIGISQPTTGAVNHGSVG